MSASTTRYSLDTSALIDGLERFYPLDHFPALWANVDVLIDSARLIATEEVWEEVQAKDEPAKEWMSSRRQKLLVQTTRDVATEVQQILAGFPLLVKAMKNRNRADPFVIAVAKLEGATVITGEANDGTANRPKIPFICGELKIPCMRFVDLVRAEGWRF